MPVSDFLMPDEQAEMVVREQRPRFGTKQVLVLTNKRALLLIDRPVQGMKDQSDKHWRQLIDVHLEMERPSSRWQGFVVLLGLGSALVAFLALTQPQVLELDLPWQRACVMALCGAILVVMALAYRFLSPTWGRMTITFFKYAASILPLEGTVRITPGGAEHDRHVDATEEDPEKKPEWVIRFLSPADATRAYKFIKAREFQWKEVRREEHMELERRRGTLRFERGERGEQ